MAESVFATYLEQRRQHGVDGLELRELHARQRAELQDRLRAERRRTAESARGVEKVALLAVDLASASKLRRDLGKLHADHLAEHRGARPRFRDVLERLRAGARDELLIDVISVPRPPEGELDPRLARYLNGMYVPRRDGSDVAFHRDGIEAYRVARDRGEVYVAQVDPDTVAAALMAASQLYPKGVTLTGSREFIELVVSQSVAMGIKVLNPELQPRIRELEAAKTSAKEVHIATNRIVNGEARADTVYDEADVVDRQMADAEIEQGEPIAAEQPEASGPRPAPSPKITDGEVNPDRPTPDQAAAMRQIIVSMERAKLIDRETMTDHKRNASQILDGTLVRSYPLGENRSVIVVREKGVNHLVDVNLSLKDVRLIARRNVVITPSGNGIKIALGRNTDRDLVLKQHLGSITAFAAEQGLQVRAATNKRDGYDGFVAFRRDLGFDQTLVAVKTENQVVHALVSTQQTHELGKGDPMRLEFEAGEWRPFYAREVELASTLDEPAHHLDAESSRIVDDLPHDVEPDELVYE